MGLVDSLFGKDARKFLKRKDSDAAEAGESLIIIIIIFHFLFAFFLFYIFFWNSEIEKMMLYPPHIKWSENLMFITC